MAEPQSPSTGRTLDGTTLDADAPLGFPAPTAPPGHPLDPAQPDAPRPWVDPLAELTTLFGLTERLTSASTPEDGPEDTLEDTLLGVLETGATLLGAQRGMVLLTQSTGNHPPAFGTVDTPGTIVGYGLDRSALGALETVPRDSGPYAGLLNGGAQVLIPGPLDPGCDDARAIPGQFGEHAQDHVPYPDHSTYQDHTYQDHSTYQDRGGHQDHSQGPGQPPPPDARFRTVARHLGIGASYALPLAVPGDGGAPFGVAVWFYDAPTAPGEHEQRLAGLYCAAASPLIALEVKRDRLRRTADALRRGLLPDRLPRLPSVQLAARCLPAGLDRSSGSDWYDALELPDGGLALSVGSVTGGGVECAAAMGRLRAALRAYAVLEGEDPVAVLGDLELLLKATEPARTATALYGYLDPDSRRLSLAGAGQCPPLLVTSFGASFVETSLSAPLAMLSCWEAPGVEIRADRGDLLLMYTEGLARRCGPSLHAGQLRLRSAAASAPRETRRDPERFCSHLLDVCLGSGPHRSTGGADIVMLAARFA